MPTSKASCRRTKPYAHGQSHMPTDKAPCPQTKPHVYGQRPMPTGKALTAHARRNETHHPIASKAPLESPLHRSHLFTTFFHSQRAGAWTLPCLALLMTEFSQCCIELFHAFSLDYFFFLPRNRKTPSITCSRQFCTQCHVI